MVPGDIQELTNSLKKLKKIGKESKITPLELTEEIMKISSRLKLTFVELAILEAMPKFFDFGEVTSVTPLYGGLINQNFAVATNDGKRRHRYFIKRYRKEATLKEIILEHQLNQYLCRDGFPEVAKCVETNEGKTFFEYAVPSLDPSEKPSRFAVYTYLDGEDRYDWLTPHCTTKDLASASAMLAKIHDRGYGFDCGEYAKDEPKILQLLDEFPKYFEKYNAISSKNPKNKSFAYYLEKQPAYYNAIENCQQLKHKCEHMLQVMVHGDFHPGNQKYSDEGVVGAFDFDWCKEDLRVFDVAITITYFCTSWKSHEDGVLFDEEIQLFLEAYQNYLKTNGNIPLLTDEELEVLPEMIVLANMYVVWWDLQEIFDVEESESDDDDCLQYLRHNSKLNDYALGHMEEIREICRMFKNMMVTQ